MQVRQLRTSICLLLSTWTFYPLCKVKVTINISLILGDSRRRWYGWVRSEASKWPDGSSLSMVCRNYLYFKSETKLILTSTLNFLGKQTLTTQIINRPADTTQSASTINSLVLLASLLIFTLLW